MHTLNVMATSTTTFAGNIIRKVTKKNYNHITFGFDNDYTHLYAFSRKYRRNILSGRFVQESLDKISVGKPIQVIVMNVEISDEDYREIKNLCIKMVHDKWAIYNYFGVATSYFGIQHLYNERNFICSSFAAYVLSKYGYMKLKRHFSIYRPEHIVEELKPLYPYSEFIYQGKRKSRRSA